jgi:BirA family transcriptional regulator, biotin operon repressor / biotin---[acetyl-CoA-carboxylase] ligase
VTVVPELVRLARVGSTMDVLHELAQGGAPAGTAVVAEVQEAGRGSRGRAWSSPRGGLWLSVLARPAETGLELLSLRAGLALAAVLSRAGAGDDLRLKWPNDLMLDQRKVGGILCEARWQGASPAWVVIGVGLNVTNPPPAALAATATHLAAARPGLTPERLTGPVVESLRRLETGPGPLGASELMALERLDWLVGRPLAGPAVGRADGIAADGALRVRRADGGVTTVRAGTVVLADLPATAGR